MATVLFFVIVRKISILILFFCFSATKAQVKIDHINANYLFGKVIRHKPEMSHLVQGPTQGFSLAYDRQSRGEKEWHQHYNYPSFGVTFVYQNMGAKALGDIYSLHPHYKFYMLERQLNLKVGLGIGYVTNPFDKVENPKNVAYGSRLTPSALIELSYQSPYILQLPLRFEAGLFLMHYSNGKMQSPNTGTNNYGVRAGFNYDISNEKLISADETPSVYEIQPWNYQLILASGLNDIGLLQSKKYPFFTATALAEKPLSFKNAIQFGADLFLNQAAKEYNVYQEAAFPDHGISADDDWKRIGIFAGHRFYMGELNLATQIGYYVYYPVNYLKRLYTRIGLQYDFSEHFFGSIMLKTHFAKAEGIEFGIGFKI